MAGLSVDETAVIKEAQLRSIGKRGRDLIGPMSYYFANHLGASMDPWSSENPSGKISFSVFFFFTNLFFFIFFK